MKNPQDKIPPSQSVAGRIKTKSLEQSSAILAQCGRASFLLYETPNQFTLKAIRICLN